MLCDTHTHVQMPQFDADREAVVRAALANDVHQMVVPGVDVPTSRAALALAQAFPGAVFAAVGTHPHDAATLTPEALAAQRALAAEQGIVAIGEIGLDYYRDLAPRETQREAFVAQLSLARDVGLPVIIHTRNSHEEAVALLRAHGQGVRGVFHCFSGSVAEAREVLDLGLYLSLAGPLTFPRNESLAEVAAWAPLDRLLVETDAPYLSPVPHRGKRNEPSRVAYVAQRLAEIRAMPYETLAWETARNAQRLFRLPEPAQKGT